ncbi:hypothetical protein PRABACTJOHN_01648 [Parabacteroides johnsonii DSM 18315]|uniref:Uncharacterized protein n=1 Tax=Parabacteroides johnsonii DSM 18315 TaxID=537006 RepID=B7B9E5_9BACT|nr:hypothetical protein PRABACTJOHN_01648 [Parabacteroides johnsonii DSM 18315]
MAGRGMLTLQRTVRLFFCLVFSKIMKITKKGFLKPASGEESIMLRKVMVYIGICFCGI